MPRKGFNKRCILYKRNQDENSHDQLGIKLKNIALDKKINIELGKKVIRHAEHWILWLREYTYYYLNL